MDDVLVEDDLRMLGALRELGPGAAGARVPERPLLILTHDSVARVGEAAAAAGGGAIARAGGYTLWALAPLGG